MADGYGGSGSLLFGWLMGTVEVAYCSLDGFIVCGWVLWEWLIACWMGPVGVVDCLLDGYCGSG